MQFGVKYQVKELFNLSCPCCNAGFESIFGKDLFKEIEFQREYADKMIFYRTCFALCEDCQISIYFERKNSQRLFIITKYHYEILEINYASFFNISRDSEAKNKVKIQTLLGLELEPSEAVPLDKNLFRHLEKLKLLHE